MCEIFFKFEIFFQTLAKFKAALPASQPGFKKDLLFFFFFQVRTSGCDALDSGGQRSAARMTKSDFAKKSGFEKMFCLAIGFSVGGSGGKV